MTIETIIIDDKSNPVELQSWFDSHPSATIQTISFKENIVYVIYH